MLSPLRSLVFRLAGSPELRPADGVVVAALIVTPLAAGYGAIEYYTLNHPHFLPFADRGVLEWAFRFQLYYVAAWVGLLVAGLLGRRYWPGSRLLAHGTVHFYMLSVAFFSYLLGHYTDLYGAMTLFGGTAVGLLLFEARIIRASILSFVGVLVVTTVAEQMEVIPYAPLYAEPPFSAGRLSTSILLAQGGFGFVILLTMVALLIAGMQRWRDREQKLRRATELIRSYVPAQLAERILAGQHHQTTRPERRKVTLFFSDVVGFTPAADQMEPEDLATLLNEYLAEMSRIAEAHGATINQFVGDGIMIFFGAPDATEDREGALRCVHMAQAMQQRMVELRAQWFERGVQVPFRIRTGINTGVASVGDFGSEGRKTYSAIGNQTNLTARIQEACEPGRILISHTTWALVHDEFPCKERGEIEVKGLHYPVRVYEVLQEKSASAA